MKGTLVAAMVVAAVTTVASGHAVAENGVEVELRLRGGVTGTGLYGPWPGALSGLGIGLPLGLRAHLVVGLVAGLERGHAFDGSVVSSYVVGVPLEVVVPLRDAAPGRFVPTVRVGLQGQYGRTSFDRAEWVQLGADVLGGGQLWFTDALALSLEVGVAGAFSITKLGIDNEAGWSAALEWRGSLVLRL